MRNRFRIDTPAFLKEIVNCAIDPLKIPLNIFQQYLGKIADRAIELNDPIMNEIMFDMNLYELPTPTSKEYSTIMDEVYKRADKYRLKHSGNK